MTPSPAPDRLTVLIDEVEKATAGSSFDAYCAALAALRAEAASVEERLARAETGRAGMREPEATIIARAENDLRWYADRLCADLPEKYEVYQTRKNIETRLSESCRVVLYVLEALRAEVTSLRRGEGDA